MIKVVSSIAASAKSVRTFLGLSAFIIFVLSAIFLTLFSRGSFDPLIENVGRLSRDQFFGLVILILSMLFIIVIVLIILSFFATNPIREDDNLERAFSMIIHEKRKKATRLEGVQVLLDMPFGNVEQITDRHGMATFIFQKRDEGRYIGVSVQKDGYLSRASRVKLQHRKVKSFSLEADPDYSPSSVEATDRNLPTSLNDDAVPSMVLEAPAQRNMIYNSSLSSYPCEDFKVEERYTYDSKGTISREKGQGLLNCVSRDIITIERTNLYGSFSLLLRSYRINGVEYTYIPYNDPRIDKRIFRVSFDTRVLRGAQTLVCLFYWESFEAGDPKKYHLDEWKVRLEKQIFQFGPPEWIPWAKKLQVDSGKNLLFRIDSTDVRNDSIIEIRNLKIQELTHPGTNDSL